MDFLTLLSTHSYSVPYYIIWLGGIVYAFVNRRKHPFTSLFAGIALGILLIVSLVSAIMTAYIQYQGFASGLPAAEYGKRQAILNICTFPFSITGWLLLLFSIFGRKNVAEREAVNSNVD